MDKGTGNIRWGIGALLFFVSALNYLDRQVLSVLAPSIQKELRLSDMDYSWITSSFLLSYTILYAISGRLVDKWGTRRSLLWFAGGWSVANVLHGFAKTVAQFCGARFLLGAAESGNFPAGVKAAAEWFPLKERALAIGLLNAGSSAGAAVAAPLVSFITLAWGWQSAFVATGIIGFVWVYCWWKYYYTPQTHPRITKKELQYIESDTEPEVSKKKAGIRQLLGMRQSWGCFVARIFIDPCTYFLIFWIPKYLQEEQSMSLNLVGYFAWIPYLALAIGTIAGGIIPRKLISNGWSLNRARKTVMLTASLLIPLCCLALFQSHSLSIALMAITGVMFGHGLWGNITLPAEVFPKSVQGTLTGLGGTLGGCASILTQFAIGWTVQNVSYTPVFIAVGLMYLLTFFGVQLLIGKLGQIIRL
ncbi:hypothetical protein A8C56_07635 [Niabella ginsenosidivorans]|uniref:Major facilitator superfamily (MFS) profile domain-containing protein n=1 Tax=Niabella ginsenosidivorans TaxID=1176587 RepID=A0A1A9HZM6_9BACT|nr:MFS transporter [Niabella ginsenosidivorans]ANH80867.1 hypothetical protein A8C56_07635 [Niabella ginsenosidivorans]